MIVERERAREREREKEKDHKWNRNRTDAKTKEKGNRGQWQEKDRKKGGRKREMTRRRRIQEVKDREGGPRRRYKKRGRRMRRRSRKAGSASQTTTFLGIKENLAFWNSILWSSEWRFFVTSFNRDSNCVCRVNVSCMLIVLSKQSKFSLTLGSSRPTSTRPPPPKAQRTLLQWELRPFCFKNVCIVRFLYFLSIQRFQLRFLAEFGNIFEDVFKNNLV